MGRARLQVGRAWSSNWAQRGSGKSGAEEGPGWGCRLYPLPSGSIPSALYIRLSFQPRVLLQLKISLKTTSLRGIYSDRQNGSGKGCCWEESRETTELETRWPRGRVLPGTMGSAREIGRRNSRELREITLCELGAE